MQGTLGYAELICQIRDFHSVIIGNHDPRLLGNAFRFGPIKRIKEKPVYLLQQEPSVALARDKPVVKLRQSRITIGVEGRYRMADRSRINPEQARPDALIAQHVQDATRRLGNQRSLLQPGATPHRSADLRPISQKRNIIQVEAQSIGGKETEFGDWVINDRIEVNAARECKIRKMGVRRHAPQFKAVHYPCKSAA
ncbi:hypothetical protein [Qipengyuania marisflavi]|uniref:hypothetical protein n=1 Tax=Qipengyuania marisflavi TaxID=2486356 RepID=UPI0014874FD8|nr:hypothetical protein [Qipengyuania marisflavi]